MVKQFALMHPLCGHYLQDAQKDGARTSLIRRYENRAPLAGTDASSWIRAAAYCLYPFVCIGAARQILARRVI